jgi:hypothetical protein
MFMSFREVYEVISERKAAGERAEVEEEADGCGCKDPCKNPGCMVQ